jgi:hypothetical protein
MTDSLATALQHCDMLLIDNLHAFDFTFDETGLHIECMDFTSEQIASAVLNISTQTWNLSDENDTHQLTCVQAFSARDEDETEQE